MEELFFKWIIESIDGIDRFEQKEMEKKRFYVATSKINNTFGCLKRLLIYSSIIKFKFFIRIFFIRDS